MADNFAIDHHSEILDKKMSLVFSQLTSCITNGFTMINDTLNENMRDIRDVLLDISNNISETSDNISEVADDITGLSNAVSGMSDLVKHLDDIDRSIVDVNHSISNGLANVIEFASNTMNDIYATSHKEE